MLVDKVQSFLDEYKLANRKSFFDQRNEEKLREKMELERREKEATQKWEEMNKIRNVCYHCLSCYSFNNTHPQEAIRKEAEFEHTKKIKKWQKEKEEKRRRMMMDEETADSLPSRKHSSDQEDHQSEEDQEDTSDEQVKYVVTFGKNSQDRSKDRTMEEETLSKSPPTSLKTPVPVHKSVSSRFDIVFGDDDDDTDDDGDDDEAESQDKDNSPSAPILSNSFGIPTPSATSGRHPIKGSSSSETQQLLLIHMLRMFCNMQENQEVAFRDLSDQLQNMGILNESLSYLQNQELFDQKFAQSFQGQIYDAKARGLTFSSFWSPSPKSKSNNASRYLTDFEFISFIGKGGFGSVVKVRNKLDQRIYAIKKIILPDLEQEAEEKKILREVAFLSRLEHRHIVRYYNAWIENCEVVVTPEEDPDCEDSHYTSDSSDYANETQKNPTSRKRIMYIVSYCTVTQVTQFFFSSTNPVHESKWNIARKHFGS